MANPFGQASHTFLSAEKTVAHLGKNFPANTSPRNVDELTQLCAEKFPDLKDWRKIDKGYTQFGRKKTVFHEVAELSKVIRNSDYIGSADELLLRAQLNEMGNNHVGSPIQYTFK